MNKWFALIIALKILVLSFFIGQSYNDETSFVEIFIKNDYAELLGPVDNLVELGTYSYSKTYVEPYTDRMPGYAFPYVFFRYLFQKGTAILMLIVFQVLFSISASLLFYKLLENLTKNRKVSFLGFVLFSLFHYMIPWELGTAPESLSLSTFVFSLYFFQIFLKDRHKKGLVFSGFFMAWAFFLRGFFGPYFLAFVLVIFWNAFQNNDQKKVFKFAKNCLLFLIPLILMESLWVGRNYISKGEFIPLQSKFVGDSELSNIDERYPFYSSFKPSILELRELIALWGGNNIQYYPNSEMNYFFYAQEKSNAKNYFPDYVFSKNYNEEHIDSLRFLVQNSFAEGISFQKQRLNEVELYRYILFSKELFHKEHGKLIVRAPFHRMVNLVANNVIADWPGKGFLKNHLLYKVYQLAVLFFYALIIFIGVISCLCFLLKKQAVPKLLMIAWFQVFLLFLTFAYLVNVAEMKYFSSAYVLLLISSTYLLSKIPIAKYLKFLH